MPRPTDPEVAQTLARILRHIHLNHEELGRRNAELASLEKWINRPVGKFALANGVCRWLKRLLSLDKSARLERQWRNTAHNSLGALSHFAALTLESAGVEPAPAETSRIAVPQLMEKLRQQLS